MKPAAFRYHRPDNLDQTLQLLAAEGADARPLAGGQSLIPAMNFRLAQPAVLIDLGRLDSLRSIEATADTLRIGAMVSQSRAENSRHVARAAPLLAEALPWIAHTQIRNRGTVGGSLAHADPAAELPVVMVALQARFRLRSSTADRWVDASDFFLGLFTTALGPGEILTDIEIPVQASRRGYGFEEFARRHGDYALAGAAAVVELDNRQRCVHSRLVILNCHDRPLVANEAEETLKGESLSAELLEAAADAVGRQVDPSSDLHASADYRRHLAGVLTRRAVATAWQRALSAGAAS